MRFPVTRENARILGLLIRAFILMIDPYKVNGAVPVCVDGFVLQHLRVRF